MKITRISTLVLLFSVAAWIPAATAGKRDTISVAIRSDQKYSRNEMHVHRFLWTKWQNRQTATAEVTFFGIDAGAIYTVEIKPDSNGHWLVREYVRHYQAPSRGPEPTNLVAEGVSLRRLRLRSGPYIVRLVTADGKAIPLFEYLG
jgi:hypothetical protein